MASNTPPPRATMALKEKPMVGATVLGCGHAHHLFKLEYFVDAPQVHLHFLTEDEEYKHNGFGKLELCCHGCGASMLLLYKENGDTTRHAEVRDDFCEKHKACANRGYETKCPDYRSSFETFDARPPVKIRRRKAS